MNDNTYPSGKGKKIAIAVLIAANLFMLVVGIITIPPNLRGDAEDTDTPAAIELVPPVSTQEPGTQEPGTQEQGTQEPGPIDTPDAVGESPAPEELPVDLSTEERPDLEDFLWYTEDVFYNGVPADANIISSISPLTGSWKAFIIYDPENEFDSNAMEYLNIVIAGTENDLSLTLDWYLIFWSNEGESFDETDMEDTVFNGKWENGGLWASGAGTIRLTQFYEINGKQYAVGTMDTPDGIPAQVALVRP